jgi:hypothetical protein
MPQATSKPAAAAASPSVRARCPAPALAFRKGDQQRDEPSRHERRADEVDSRQCLHRRLGDEALDENPCDRDRHSPDEEEPSPGEVVDDQSREDDAEASANAEDGGDEPDRHPDFLTRKLVSDDSVAEREDRRTGALKCSPGDQRPDVPGCAGADRADEEDRERDEEETFLAVLVAELPEDRRCNGRDEQEDREHPGDPGRRRVQVVLQRRQRRDDHRLLKRVRDPGQGEDRERDVVVLPLVFHWASAA